MSKSNIFFKPWIGSEYESGGIFGKKILVVGESHYCGVCNECGLKYNDCCDDLTTTKCIENYLNPEYDRDRWMNTFVKFERSMVNHETDFEERSKIWNSVAFFNFLQVTMNEARDSGTVEDYEEGGKAFLEVINILQPEIVIVWGVTRMYNFLPEEGWNEGDTITVDGYNVLNGYYKLNTDKECRVFNVYHPSVGYDWSWWHKVIKYFINK